MNNAPSHGNTGALAPLRYKPNLEATLRRHAAVWRGEQLDRPLILVDEEDTGVRTVGQRTEWWRNPDGFIRQCSELFARRAEVKDDRLPILRPPFSHAILPALLGAEITEEGGALWVKGRPCATPEAFLETRLDPERDLGRRFAEYYGNLLTQGAGHFLVAPYEAMGPCDLAAAMLGTEEWLLLAASEPGKAVAVAQHAALQAQLFYRWVQKMVGARQPAYGGTILSQMWAPPETIYFCDHTAVNLGPDLYRRIVRPAEQTLTDGFSHAYLSTYPQTAQAVLGPMIEGIKNLRIIYGCAENPTDEFLLEHAGRCVFFLRCQTRPEIDRYRRLTGDRGLILWTFVHDVAEANRLVASL